MVEDETDHVTHVDHEIQELIPKGIEPPIKVSLTGGSGLARARGT